MMANILTMGKYLDQPLLVSKVNKAVPTVLIAGAGVCGLHNVSKSKDKKRAFVKNSCVLGFTIGSALIATRGMKSVKLFGRQIVKGFSGLSGIKSVKEAKQIQTELVNSFIQSNNVNEETSKILEKAKENVLNLSELKHLYANFSKSNHGKTFLQKLIPDPQNLSSKDIFGEIGKLSLMGLVPVVGGITGGIIGDCLTEKNWKNRIPDKIKEGSYQYLANIFLCNVGAGAALGIMEKMNVKSKAARAGGMVAGIILTGVICGSAIANYIGKKCINPLFNKNCRNSENLYSERKPEVLDVGLHIDDAATVAVMSGLRWIEPVLPVLYSVSGYRAGIGYRNGETVQQCKDRRENRHRKHQIKNL